MRHSNRAPRVWLALAVLACVAGASTLVAGAPAPLERLQAQIARAASAAHGTVGIAVKHLESGADLYVNADEPFPMASTFKLPVLIELYAKAKAGTPSWDEMIDVGLLDCHDDQADAGDLGAGRRDDGGDRAIRVRLLLFHGGGGDDGYGGTVTPDSRVPNPESSVSSGGQSCRG